MIYYIFVLRFVFYNSWVTVMKRRQVVTPGSRRKRLFAKSPQECPNSASFGAASQSVALAKTPVSTRCRMFPLSKLGADEAVVTENTLPEGLQANPYMTPAQRFANVPVSASDIAAILRAESPQSDALTPDSTDITTVASGSISLQNELGANVAPTEDAAALALLQLQRFPQDSYMTPPQRFTNVSVSASDIAALPRLPLINPSSFSDPLAALHAQSSSDDSLTLGDDFGEGLSSHMLRMPAAARSTPTSTLFAQGPEGGLGQAQTDLSGSADQGVEDNTARQLFDPVARALCLLG